MRRFTGAILLIRPLNGAIAVLSLIPAVFLGSGQFNFPVRVGIASFFIISFGYAVNDLFDFRTDKINKPWRAIPSGRLSAWQAINVALFCLTIGLVSLVGSEIAVIAFFIGVVVALFLYAFKISSIFILGNLWAAMLSATAFILGGLITHPTASRWKILLAATCLSFLFHLGREIIKDVQDISGDRHVGRKTLPIVFGERTSCLLAVAVYFCLIVTTYLVYFWLQLSHTFLYVTTAAVNIPIVLILAKYILRRNSHQCEQASRWLKLLMIPALAALMLAGLNTP